MSNDTGLAIKMRRKDSKWIVFAVNASSGYHSPLSEHEGRVEAIDAATKELQGYSGYEYGLMHIDPDPPVKDKS